MGSEAIACKPSQTWPPNFESVAISERNPMVPQPDKLLTKPSKNSIEMAINLLQFLLKVQMV
jgi:hypothetical protein